MQDELLSKQLEELNEKNRILVEIIEQALNITQLRNYKVTDNGEGFLCCIKKTLISRSDCPELFEYILTKPKCRTN